MDTEERTDTEKVTIKKREDKGKKKGNTTEESKIVGKE